MTVDFTILHMIDGEEGTLCPSLPHLVHFFQKQDKQIFSSHEQYRKTCIFEYIRCCFCHNLSLLTSAEESVFCLSFVSPVWVLGVFVFLRSTLFTLSASVVMSDARISVKSCVCREEGKESVTHSPLSIFCSPHFPRVRNAGYLYHKGDRLPKLFWQN